MTRQEVGSYLGLKLETVSRALSSLNSDGIIHVHQRTIDILDAAALRAVIDPAANAGAGAAVQPKTASARRGGKTRSPQRAGFAWQQLAAI